MNLQEMRRKVERKKTSVKLAEDKYKQKHKQIKDDYGLVTLKDVKAELKRVQKKEQKLIDRMEELEDKAQDLLEEME